jgi:Zn-dependent membrane protease YugP
MFIDPLYFIILAPALIFSFVASMLVKGTFARYARVASRSGMTGSEAAASLLHTSGIDNVRIEKTQGFLSDHYDPRHRVLRLSPDVYGSPSLAAIGVACHEAGHAIQHARAYAPLVARTAMVPVVQFGSNFGIWFIMAGMFFAGAGVGRSLMLIGIGLFSLAVLFSLVTLPVEWDASSRAKKLMVRAGIVSTAEVRSAGAVLNAAFLTYLASAVSAILTLVYYLMRAGLLGRSRDD